MGNLFSGFGRFVEAKRPILKPRGSEQPQGRAVIAMAGGGRIRRGVGSKKARAGFGTPQTPPASLGLPGGRRIEPAERGAPPRPSSRSLRCLRAFWGRLRGCFWFLWSLFRGIWDHFSPPEASWDHLGASWKRLGSSWGSPWASMGVLGSVLEASWPVLGAFLAVLAASWAVLGRLGPSLGSLEAVWGPPWSRLGLVSCA